MNNKQSEDILKKVLFINQDSGYLMIDIINTYVDAGYSCALITGRLIVRNTPLNAKVKVERIIEYNRKTTFKRLFTWIIGFVQIWLRIVIKHRKDSLFIVSNPPFAPLLPLIVKNPFGLLIFDIYPDVLSELGYMSQASVIVKLWKKLNRKVFARASDIFTITNSMGEVLQQYVGSKSVKLVSLWTDNTFLRPVDPAINPFLVKHHLSGRFVVLYSGNIGLSGDVDILIDVAYGINRDDILFLIIGEGAKKEWIIKKVNELDLKNFILLPWQPVALLPFTFSSASLAVISLGTGASMLAIPSKLYNFLSVGAPLLCISSKGSEVDSLVEKYECGKNFEPTDIDGIRDFIIKVAESEVMHKLMKVNSLEASKDFSSVNIYKFLPSQVSK